MKNQLWKTILAATAVSAIVAAPGARAADTGASNRGKEVRLIVGYNPGGGYDFYARLIANHFGDHLPGKPVVIVQNMPGVGSIKAANYIYQQAPRDGSVIGMVGDSLAIDQRLGKSAIKYDAAKFNWIGRMADNVEVSVVWHTSPVQTIQQAMKEPVVCAGTSPDGTTFQLPTILNQTAGTKIEVVTGYSGTNGALLAMERGETQCSHATWVTLAAQHADWVRDHKINVLVQYAPERIEGMPDVPTSVELARPGRDRAVAALFASAAAVGRAMMAPPEVSPSQVKLLRSAFTATMKDPKFLADVHKANGDLAPLDGAELQKVVDDAIALPDDVAAFARQALAAGAKESRHKGK
jgi:tripartite-type tricarboxylate transporter receptor subunit TctC